MMPDFLISNLNKDSAGQSQSGNLYGNYLMNYYLSFLVFSCCHGASPTEGDKLSFSKHHVWTL